MKTKDFLCGIIEGYYGRPWSFYQRKILFDKFGLNSYVYAPKDDVKHRSRWRDLYSPEELIELNHLIDLAKGCGINFVYALSPGLDLIYSSEKEFSLLKRKFDQLSNVGCQSWAILFDDIENEMSQQDQNHFLSFAHAQVSITNQLYEYLHKPNLFLFCPTEYCSQMAKPSVEKSLYLQTIGNGLHEDIQIFWTGPKVISRRIELSHLEEINSIVHRRVTIWDNLNANDYDQRRLCLGPFSGRSSNICSQLSGILINPNCEFELNFIPLNTLGQWFQSFISHSTEDPIDDEQQQEHSTCQSIEDIYRSDEALERAILEWLPEFNKIKSSNDYQMICKVDHSPQAMSPKSLICSLVVDDDSQDSINENLSSSTLRNSSSTKIHRMECDLLNVDVTLDDIRLLVDLFYLPYENGGKAQQIFLDFHWLIFHYSRQEKSNEWRCRSLAFHNHTKTINRLVQRLTTIPNRCLLYDLYNYITDMNSTISLCSRYLHWLDDEKRSSNIFLSGDVDPGSKRGGLAGEFLSLLPLGDFQSLIKFDSSSPTNFFFIRPMNSSDQSSIYNLCRNICYEDRFEELLSQHSDILVDRLVGGYWLTCFNQFDCCYSVESKEDFLCGFVFTLIESEKYDQLIQVKWIEQLQQKYSNVDRNLFHLISIPHWIYDQYPIRLQLFVDFSMKPDEIYHLGEKLLRIVKENLLQRGFHGCHLLFDEQNCFLHQFYLRLGFVHIPNVDENDHFILLVKQF